MTTPLIADIIKSHPDEDQRRALFDFWCEYERMDDNPEALEEFERACGIVTDNLDSWFEKMGLVVADKFSNYPRLAQ